MNAEYTIDGVAGSSTSNKLTSAIPGVTLELKALTTTTGPVTVEVQPPGPSVSAIATQVQAFVTLYNSTIAAINTQLTTKPPSDPPSTAELQTGTLFGDFELTSLLQRDAPVDLRTGRRTAGGNVEPRRTSASARARRRGKGTPAQSALEGQLTVNTAQLESAIQANPAGVEKMLQSFSKGFQGAGQRKRRPGGLAGSAHHRRHRPRDPELGSQDHDHERNARHPPENAAG